MTAFASTEDIGEAERVLLHAIRNLALLDLEVLEQRATRAHFVQVHDLSVQLVHALAILVALLVQTIERLGDPAHLLAPFQLRPAPASASPRATRSSPAIAIVATASEKKSK